MKTIICRYDEIALKKGNRSTFEKRLQKNIQLKIKQSLEIQCTVRRLRGCIQIEFCTDINNQEQSIVQSALETTFGIANFSFVEEVAKDIRKIESVCEKLFEKVSFTTFRISARRSDKSFPLTSEDIERRVGLRIVDRFAKKVNLKNPEVTCFIDIRYKNATLSLHKYPGPGGLPVCSSGKVLTLLSGGIDSPVAANLIMKRGALTELIHFHSVPYTSPASLHKVEELAQILSHYYSPLNLYTVPVAHIQRAIAAKCVGKLRIILLRRCMNRIAQQVAQNNNCLALVTGESLGQVASQTLENIVATDETVSMPILRPLIGWNKQEIIAYAQKIQTLKTSNQPHEDCCTLFIPKNPETKADKVEVDQAESLLDIDGLVEESLQKTKQVFIYSHTKK